jgi:phosphoribosyl-AMP cyclohydrolase
MSIEPRTTTAILPANPQWSLTSEEANALAGTAKFDSKGLLTAVAVDQATGDILMLAHMNVEALLKTLRTGVMCYWSRSRGKLWVKGETTGNFQLVREVHVDCDGDAWLFRIDSQGDGAACHEGYRSCFFRKLVGSDWQKQGAPVSKPTPH